MDSGRAQVRYAKMLQSLWWQDVEMESDGVGRTFVGSDSRLSAPRQEHGTESVPRNARRAACGPPTTKRVPNGEEKRQDKRGQGGQRKKKTKKKHSKTDTQGTERVIKTKDNKKDTESNSNV